MSMNKYTLSDILLERITDDQLQKMLSSLFKDNQDQGIMNLRDRSDFTTYRYDNKGKFRKQQRNYCRSR